MQGVCKRCALFVCLFRKWLLELVSKKILERALQQGQWLRDAALAVLEMCTRTRDVCAAGGVEGRARSWRASYRMLNDFPERFLGSALF